MTTQLYLKDCYLKEFDAAVATVNGNEVELDRTAFYPNAGGQPDDTGILTCGGRDYIVASVRKDKGRIIHHLDRPGLKEGDQVHGQVDWTRRYLHMRYHTGSHVLSGVIYQKAGAEITGNQIDIDMTRIDFNLEDFDRAKVKEYEAEANRILKEGHKVNINFLPREEAARIPSVTKLAMGLPEAIREVRMVSVEGFEQEACGGTHVANTSEVGEVEIVGTENKGKKNRRIYFRLKGEGDEEQAEQPGDSPDEE